jgi:hypothetical protein
LKGLDYIEPRTASKMWERGAIGENRKASVAEMSSACVA